MADVSYGDKAPDVVNVIIEIKKGERNKYEFDKETGRLTLDRVNATALGYPSDYGYIPNTLCEDGDPLDALLVIDESVPHGTVVPAKPIGVLDMEDDGEGDQKIICVPAEDLSKDHIETLDDMGPHFRGVVEHFFAHYKDWKNNWKGSPVTIHGWGDVTKAKQVIRDSIELAQKQ